MEVVEVVERDAARFEVVGQAVAGEDARRRKRDAAVGEAVARVCELSEAGDVRALARLAADRTGIRVPESCSPPVRSRLDPVRDDVELETLAVEYRLDQLVEAARDDQRPMTFRELGEPVADPDVLDHPGDDLLERRAHALELHRDHLVQGQVATELVLRRVVDPLVAELEQDEMEPVRLGDGSVPVEDELHGATLCESTPMPATSSSTVLPGDETVHELERRPEEEVARAQRRPVGCVRSRNLPSRSLRRSPRRRSCPSTLTIASQPVRIELVRRYDDRAEREREVAILRRAEGRSAPVDNSGEAAESPVVPDDGRHTRKNGKPAL